MRSKIQKILSHSLITGLAFTVSGSSLQGKAETALIKNQILVTHIQYDTPNSLTNIWPTIQTILDKSQEVSISLESELELNKLILPIPIQIKTDDALETTVQTTNQAQKLTLDSMSKLKSQESDFLSQPVYDTSDNNIDNLRQQLTILGNFDNQELNNRRSEVSTADTITIKSITVTATNLNIQAEDNLNQLSKIDNQKIKEVDLRSANQDSQADQELQPSLKLKSNNVKVANPSDQLNKKLKKQKAEFQSFSSSSSGTISTVVSSQAKMNSNSQSSTSAIVSSASSLKEEILTNRDILQLDSISDNWTKDLPITKNLKQENNEQDQLRAKNKNNKSKQKSTKITKYRYTNPYYTSPEDQKRKDQMIKEENQKALDHNKKVKQYYSEQEYTTMVKNKTLPDPNQYSYAITDNEGNELSKNKLDSIRSSLELSWIDQLLNIGGIKTSAKGLNRSSNSLLIYNWSNNGFTFDIPSANMTSGTQLVTWYRNGSTNQKFWFNNFTNEIVTALGPVKCLDMYGGGITSGTKVGLWDCNGQNSQKWVFNGTSLSPMVNTSYCVDAEGSLAPGAKLILWQCHGGNNQLWLPGDNNFSDNYYIRITANPGEIISGGILGHAATGILNGNNLVNTFSAWDNGGNDYESNNNPPTINNNIGEGDAIWVDKTYDRSVLSQNTNGYKSRTESLSKQYSDALRFANGYRINYVNRYREYSYNIGSPFTCATEASSVWNLVMPDGKKVNYTYLPSVIWASI